MAPFFASTTRILLAFFMLLTNVFTFATGNEAKKIKDHDDGCQMSFAAVSDAHVQDMSLFEWLLDCGLLDMSKAEDRLDAVVFNGDNTNLGSDAEYERFAKAVGQYDIADQTILTIGNHDTWCGSWDGPRSPEESIETFCKWNRIISGREIGGPYYSTEINGFPAIILGSESNDIGAYLSPEQLEWFAGEMEKAGETGLPIFVFLHQSINGTHGLPYNWEREEDADFDDGGIGPQSDAVLEIIEKYDNVFYISGHIHAGFSVNEKKNGYLSIEKHDGYTLINLPSYSIGDFFQHGGEWQIGTGYVVETYADKVMFRARNFITGTWLTKYDVSVPII